MSTDNLRAHLFPADEFGQSTIEHLTRTDSDGYSGVFILDNPILEGYVRIQSHQELPRREIVVNYSIGGNPGHIRSTAPVISADGQVTL